MIFTRDWVVYLFLDTFESRKCLETGEMTKSLENNDFSRDLVGFLFLHTSEYRKCLESGETTKCLENNYFFLFPDPFEKGKCLETGKRQNPLNTERV